VPGLPYRSGRLGDSVKVTSIDSDSFFIVDYEPSTAALGGIGRLPLAVYKGAELVYVGGVGTGFKERPTIKLRQDVDKLTSKPPVTLKRSGVVWAQLALVAEIDVRAWTDDGKFRDASYKGPRKAGQRSRLPIER
jgi:bifunctional non-homologous end joining protein LigD